MLLGLASASLFAQFRVPAWVAQLPPAHAGIALFGWLTLLIYGVSTRTLRPITGNRSSRPLLHVIAGSATLAGGVLLAAGAGTTIPWLVWAGASFIAAGAAAYVIDVATVLSGSTVTYRPPQCFIGAAVVWLIVALALGAGSIAGEPWQTAFVFVMLAGWAGQMVNGHLLHIGVRLIATIYRGNDDETEPAVLLDPIRPWLVFVAMQFAVAFIAIGLIADNAAFVAAGSVFGTIAWVALIVALAHARRMSAAA
jgi:hypothetical protein